MRFQFQFKVQWHQTAKILFLKVTNIFQPYILKSAASQANDKYLNQRNLRIKTVDLLVLSSLDQLF
jgi:hypothetical protein